MKTLTKLLLTVTLLAASTLFASLAHATAVVNLVTTEAGMHRISYQQLKDQGADLQGVRHSRLSLTLAGEPVAVRSKGQDEAAGSKRFFGSGGYIEFYAEPASGPDTLYSEQQVYTLHVSRNLRSSIRSQRNRFNRTQAATRIYQQTELIEQETMYDFLSPSTTDPWHFGQLFSFGGISRDYNFNLDNVAGDASIDAQVYGLGDLPIEGNDHHYTLSLNGVEFADEQFEGQTVSDTQASDVPLLEGENTITVQVLVIAGAAFDTIALNQLEVRYPRNTVAVDGYLEGFFDSAQAVVSGLGDARANVYRKDADGTITRITGNRRVAGDTGFNTGGVAADYIVVNDNGFKTPSVALINDDAEIRSGSAEYLILTHQAFFGEELDALVQLRQADYSVKVVDVAQIYGQFGNHRPSADAIKDYIQFAVTNLGTRYVTIVGADTYDYFQREASPSISFVPTAYISTRAGNRLVIHQTPTDVLYGDLDDDAVPDVPVGRLSARTPEELGYVIEKIRDYQAREGYAGRILMAADREDIGAGLSFTQDANDMVEAIPQAIWRNSVENTNRINFRAYPDLDGDVLAKEKLITGLNGGVSVVGYIGHSSRVRWSRSAPRLLEASEIQSLVNIDKPALVTQWGCFNTYFVHYQGNSMADRFLVGGENGAVAVLGASTLTTAGGERRLGIELNKYLYGEGVTIGDAVVAAKRAFAEVNPNDLDILLGWQILGDPTLKVNP